MPSKAVTVSSTFSLNAFSLAYGSSRVSRAIVLRSPKDHLPKAADHPPKDNPLPTSPRGGGNFYKNKNNPFIS